ncbi:Wadjet anti-phage system protein JetD domain-containing protein [Rhizobium sp. BK176]|uniref:Wadjet anti-phage system protein JetD domain-containing protein n=1 Tax=Rhizobium sp. BK176 TaxID=2587071 RepID=UPI0021685F31|nr:Wadjet anti-phage system protein JetD domain-containing protein [Rhizobium sp. BK176]MCS4089696.1 hypothetical protein [Rhizobium sp. BK176]
MTRFVDLLVRRVETNPRSNRWLNVDDFSYANAKEKSSTLDRLTDLCALGGLQAKYGTNGLQRTIKEVRPLDLDSLYAALGRRPHAEAAREATSSLRQGAEDWETAVIDHIEGLWSRHAKWCGISLAEADRLQPLQRVSRAIRNGLHAGRDMRTFSTREGGDSKFVEKNDAAILSYVYHREQRPDGTLREILARSGSIKITSPVLVSGAFSIGDLALGQELSYCGLPIHRLDDFSLDRRPDYVLTVENLVSFHRHAVEINDDQSGLVLFTSGQASIAFKEFYAMLVTQLADVPFFHWSDIDEGGLEITKTIMGVNPAVRPHLMSLDLVMEHGARATAPVADDGRFMGTWMAEIAAYLAIPGNRSLEQEMIEPTLPEIGR